LIHIQPFTKTLIADIADIAEIADIADIAY